MGLPTRFKMEINWTLFSTLILFSFSFCITISYANNATNTITSINETLTNPNTFSLLSRQLYDSSDPKVRNGRQVYPGLVIAWSTHQQQRAIGGDTSCNFGSTAEQLTLCHWQHSNLSTLQWTLTSGVNTNWIGGPPLDGSQELEGGYMVYETSQIPNIAARSSQSAILEGPIAEPTSSAGNCLAFNYAIDGLSVEKLRVLLHPVPNFVGLNKDIEEATQQLRDQDHGDDVVLWETRDSTDGQWKAAEVVFTYRQPYQIYFEGIPRDSSQLSRRFRGFIAIDNINLQSSDKCPGHCNFDGGFCDWSNEAEGDDFEWSLGRGSQNPATGPLIDRASYTHGGSDGGYAYIDSSFPRTSGDKARLASRAFSMTEPNSPLCMRFWTHMFGNGIGTLRILIHDLDATQDHLIWSLSGEAGNTWYQGQVPISSFTPFKIIFEGEVGKNNLGDIAIDDISYAPGACSSAPQTAASISGDCAFEIDECGWTNVGANLRTDEMDWERRIGQNARTPIPDHTLGSPTGNFMTLSGEAVQRAGDRAWMLSPQFKGTGKPKCLSFWYYMNEPFIDKTGPSLGGLKVYTRPIANNDLASLDMRLTPIWRLYNQQSPIWRYAQARITEPDTFQVVFEGVHGSSRANGILAVDDIAYFDGDCTTHPPSGFISDSDCSFEKDLCLWKNTSSDPIYRWQLATITRRPANLPDKTFGAPVGYAYFDIFSQTAQGTPVRLVSPVVPALEKAVCFHFWYAAFGAGESTLLRVFLEEVKTGDADGGDDEGSKEKQIWRLTAVDLDTVRPEWRPAQVSFQTDKQYRIVMEGQANNGGFAIDELSLHLRECPIRPKEAGAGIKEEYKTKI